MTWSRPRRVNIVARALLLLGAPRQDCAKMGYTCGPGWGGRQYYSRDERLAWLNDYAEELENELKGVKERIAELKGAREA